ncbi:MBL fold metallo-hydrolase [Azotosporobacter soli]|uniref:MBL fold metallo-hydrolase n=1 Tax=Azotosporobacter soli TaxID=3055040 RepID=UPI0031FEF94E
MKELTVTYLEHSGFAVRCADDLLVFDYFRDPAERLPVLIEKAKRILFFSSHAHSDHFVATIGNWQNQVRAYILSEDIHAVSGMGSVAHEKIIYCKPYQRIALDDLTIETYGSTDAGVSFCVALNGWRIFHAGDLNRWHWTGDTPANRKQADAAWRRELAKVAGLTMDLAFFPVDQRLGEYRAAGVKEFCDQVRVKQLVTMHSNGAPWQPPFDFPVPVWSPLHAGEEFVMQR